MSDFKKQIEEDIKEYQEKFKGVYPDIMKAEWAFNFWVLDKFFYEEEDLIIDKITDYRDHGIDAYEWYEDTKDLYLIQNKFYSDNTSLSLDYVQNTFLVVPLAVLTGGNYGRSKELQQIYSNNCDDEEFTLHLQLYVTNNQSDKKILDAIKEFNKANSPRILAEVFFLSDIEDKWYGESRKQTKVFSALVESVNEGTILNINNADYHLESKIDARYVFAPVACMYRMMKAATDIGYELFEKNIREYLGNRGINKKIYQTLKDEHERKYFFYYNNGITIICNQMKATQSTDISNDNHIGIMFEIVNPQIVNGCQTVNSIFAALKEYDDEDVEKQFQDTFVMLKILQIDAEDAEQQQLSKNIVTYNNSQNSLDEKQFVANNELFQRLKNEFADKGFLLLTRQSDKNKYQTEFGKKSALSKLQLKSITRRTLFGLEKHQKLTDLEIPLEKFLQVVLAFKVGGLAAYTMKKDVLKPETQTYNTVIEFLKSSNATTEVLLNLYLLYMSFEKEKNAKKDEASTGIIPFYAIDGFSRNECGRDTKRISDYLDSKEKIRRLISVYRGACKAYAKNYITQHNTDYTKMIKADIDYTLFDTCYSTAIDIIESY